MNRGRRVPGWVLWLALSVVAMALFCSFALVLLGVTDGR